MKRRTTQKRFWEILATRKGGWRIDKGGNIRRVIRGRGPTCPLCDVANAISGRHEGDLDDMEATEYLGLDPYFAQDVVDAADFDPEDINVQKFAWSMISDRTTRLRNRLIRLLKPKRVDE